MNPNHSTNPPDLTDLETLRIQGLEYYGRTDHYGQTVREVGSTDTDLPAAAALIAQEAERLGDILGLERFKRIAGTDRGQRVIIQPFESDVELLVASKNSVPLELINTIRQTA